MTDSEKLKLEALGLLQRIQEIHCILWLRKDYILGPVSNEADDVIGRLKEKKEQAA